MLSLTSLSDWGIDPYSLPAHPDITTVDNPANHVVPAGAGLDGVVELIVDGQFLCTGTLLPTRRHILTAAHCIDGATTVDVNFHLAGGVQTFTVMADNLFVHPDFDIDNIDAGADIGIVELDQAAPAGVASFDIDRTPLTQVSVVDVVGYGVGGQGIEQFIDGNKRDGQNRYELFFDAAQTMIMYDFDNGSPANDAIGIATGVGNLGLGNQEVLAVGGDSGSPTFLNGRIVGVHSFRTTLAGGVADAVPGINGSFGELSVDGLTSANAPFIDAIIVDQAGAPRITDVLLDGSSWNRDPISYAAIVPTGKQLAPIFTQGIDTIKLKFSEHVYLASLANTEFALFGDNDSTPILASGLVVEVELEPTLSHVATWTFDAPLPAGKYRIELSTHVTDIAGNALDGEWENLPGLNAAGMPTWDDFSDDPTGRSFLSGNGTPGSPNNRFEFFFSVFPGDYDQNGIIDMNDLASVQDGNGDGVVDTADEQFVTTAINTPTPYDNYLVASQVFADYNRDEIVDTMDYLTWKTDYGNYPEHPNPAKQDMKSDGNLSGFVDGGDYVRWRNNLGIYSAWYTGPLPPSGGSGGGGLPVVQFGEAPRVANAIISGSNSPHPDYSFETHVGSGAQLQAVPVALADTISITFTEDVNITANMLSLVGLRTANRPTLADFSYDLGTMTASWRFEGWALADQYAISLSDSVTDVEGNALDGEWTNPVSIFTTNSAVSVFPSGDGTAGGDFNFVATLLPGDANQDGIVNSVDMGIAFSHWGQWSMVFTDGDFNGDGTVNSLDAIIWSQNNGANLQSLQVLADLNGDWRVDESDASILASNTGLSNPTQADGDLNGDGSINSADLDLMFAQWGLTLALAS